MLNAGICLSSTWQIKIYRKLKPSDGYNHSRRRAKMSLFDLCVRVVARASDKNAPMTGIRSWPWKLACWYITWSMIRNIKALLKSGMTITQITYRVQQGKMKLEKEMEAMKAINNAG
jgi:hypothetical protein